MIEPSKQLQKIFDSSVEITKSYKHRLITLEHLIFAIVSDEESSAGLQAYGADVDYIKSNLDHYLKNNLKDIETDDKALPKKYINSCGYIKNLKKKDISIHWHKDYASILIKNKVYLVMDITSRMGYSRGLSGSCEYGKPLED